jgi:hypothetical protein
MSSNDITLMACAQTKLTQLVFRKRIIWADCTA